MRTAIPFRRLSLLTAAAFALALAPHAAAQSELAVTPGQGTLNTAIENDTNRPADRVYVLQRGAYYGVTREINNVGYTLRIRAANGTGNRPVIHPGIDATGTPVASRYFNLGADTYFNDIYFLAVNPQQGENATSFALNAEGMRLVVDGCVFQGGRSRLIEVNVDDTDLFFSNSQFRNMYRESDTSNGRPIDYRTVRGDSLVITNTSFIGVNGYLVRYDGPVLNTVIMDHITVFGTNRELTTNSFGTQVVDFRFTNSLVVNAFAEGQAPEEANDDGTFPDPDGVVKFDSLDADIDNGVTEADRRAVIRDNGFMTSAPLQAFYDARTAAGDPLEAYTLIDDAILDYAEVNSNVTLDNNMMVDVTFTDPPELDEFVQFFQDLRDGSPTPAVWYFGQFDANGDRTDDLFPATQPPPEDFSYATTNPAFTAGQGGLPLGDLNYFPVQLAIYNNAPNGGLAVDREDDARADGFTLEPAFPNPAASRTTFRVALDAAATVTLSVYDALGRAVLTVPSASVAAGSDQRMTVDVSALPSGLYLVRATAEAGGDVRTQTTQFSVVR